MPYTTAAAALIGVGTSVYEGTEQRKQANRALGAQPKPPNTTQPDESGLQAQGINRLSAANGRNGTLLAAPVGFAPMPSLGLGQPAAGTKTTLGG